MNFLSEVIIYLHPKLQVILRNIFSSTSRHRMKQNAKNKNLKKQQTTDCKDVKLELTII